MAKSQLRLCEKTFLTILFVLVCLPIAGSAQSAEQNRDEDMVTQKVAFKDASLKSALAVLGKQLKINVVYDDTVKDAKLNIELNDVTIKAAMKIILVQQRLQARLIEDKTILVIPDNETIRRRYEKFKVWPADPEK